FINPAIKIAGGLVIYLSRFCTSSNQVKLIGPKRCIAPGLSVGRNQLGVHEKLHTALAGNKCQVMPLPVRNGSRAEQSRSAHAKPGTPSIVDPEKHIRPVPAGIRNPKFQQMVFSAHKT